MKLSDAMLIVLELAEENQLDYRNCESESMLEICERQVQAMAVVREHYEDILTEKPKPVAFCDFTQSAQKVLCRPFDGTAAEALCRAWILSKYHWYKDSGEWVRVAKELLA